MIAPDLVALADLVAASAVGWVDGLRHHGRDRACLHALDPGALGGDVAADCGPVTSDPTGWPAPGDPCREPSRPLITVRVAAGGRRSR